MSISSVLNPVVFTSVAGATLDVSAGARSAPVAVQSIASINDAFTAMLPNTSPALSLGALATPRGAAVLGRSSKSAGVPTLSAEDVFDLQRSVDLLAQSTEGASAIGALQHKTAMAILRNIAG